MKRNPPRAVILLALALPLDGACSFLKPRADLTKYFVLTSKEPKEPVVGSPVVVGVDHIELPEYLVRPELVARSASNQLTISEYEQWGEPIREGFSRTFRRDLENQLGAGHVVAAPFDPARRPALSVDLTVRRFERVGEQSALLEASWTIRDGKSGAMVATHDSRKLAPLTGPDAAATVAALSSALAALAEEIAAAVRTQTAPAATGSAR